MYPLRFTPGNPYPNWKFKDLYLITNPVSIPNYQHKLLLTWAPGMADDFRDIRFAEVSGVKCSYYIESYVSRTSAVVWVNVPDANQAYMVVYYGNGQVISESNGSNVFDFFDDFLGTTLNTSVWTKTSYGTAGVSGGILSFTGTSSGSYDSDIKSKSSIFKVNTVLESLCKGQVMGSDNWGGLGGYGSAIIFVDIEYTGSGATGQIQVGANTQNCGLTNTIIQSYNIHSITRNSTTSVIYKVAGITVTVTASIPSVDHQIWLSHLYNTTTGYYDWVRVRKHVATEPSLALLVHKPNVLFQMVAITTPVLSGRSWGYLIW